MSILRRKSSGMLGIDISSTAVKLLELSQSGEQFRVESYSVEPLPPNSVVEKNITDVELVGEAIGRLVGRAGTKTRTAACAVSGSSVITKVIPMPADLSEDEMEGQIMVEADQYIPYPLEEVRLDFDVLGPSEDDSERVDVLLAASRSDNVDVRVAALELGGLEPKVVDVEAFALENTIAMIKEGGSGAEPYQTIAVVDIGATATTLSVLKDLKIIYTREQLFGGRQLTEDIQRRYGLSYEEAGMSKRQGGLPDNYESEVLGAFKEQMAQEVNRALQFFYSSSQENSVDEIIMAGGCASIEGVADLIEAKTGVSTIIANPFSEMSISSRVRPEVLSNDAPAMMIACGLALRSFD